MPFRFNHKDLSVLASQPSEQFNKEGILWFKEKEGKLFNKSENFSERICRLRGNLLFYFKGRDKTSECSGIIVLERFNIVPDTSFKKHGFILEFDETDEQKYEFAASSQQEYDEWLALLKNASYEKLQNRILELRTELLALTGQDPLSFHHVNVSQDTPKDKKGNQNRISLFCPSLEEYDGDKIMMEMCIACTNLVPEYESLPSAMVKVSTVIPPETKWTRHSHTEICEESRDPNFLRTFVFTSSFPPVTRLKFVVYDVLSKSKNDTVIIGQSVCTIQQVQEASDCQISLSVMNMDKPVGTLFIQSWRRESSGHENMKAGFSGPEGKDGAISQPLKPYVTNVTQRSFHFPTRDGNDLKFQEFLAESTLCFKIPKLLLSLYITEEKEGVVELHNIGQLHPEWERIKQVVQNSHFDLVHQYSTNLADLTGQYEEQNFKRSVDKAKKELEFIPTNLHIQRLCVIETDHKEYIYDVVTVGAPTAHSLKFRHGGLKRLIASSEDTTRKALQSYGDEEKRKTGFIKACHVKDVAKRLKAEMAEIFVDLKKSIETNQCENLNDASTQLSNKVGELLGLCATSFVQESEEDMLKARTNGPELRIKSTIIYSDIDNEKYKSLNWEWTGTEFKATDSKDVEKHAGVYEANTEFLSAVNYVCKTETFTKKVELSKLSTNLENCVNSLIRKLNVMMQFVLMQEEADCPGLKELRNRRDIVLSQAITPVISGFALMLSKRIYDLQFLEQITNIGLLIHFESLLATYGDEMGMIEDMYTGLQDLRQVNFKIVGTDSDTTPTLSGNRTSIIVEFPVKTKLFKQLPLKLQQRQIIHLHPVLFSLGINEQATLAERFGDTSLQETINAENLSYLQIYFDAFMNFSPHNTGSRSKDATSLPDLMDQLKTTVSAKKSKNYDILLLSEELCARMNGLRVTSCKSAKDRSSMSVTLETVRTLEREHCMREDVSQRVLSSIRSQGTRLINSYKNVGLPKYAFNKVQVKALPSVYRPPEGTIGKYLQT